MKEDRGRRLLSCRLLTSASFCKRQLALWLTPAVNASKSAPMNTTSSAAGSPAATRLGSPNDPKVVKISVFPDQRIVSRKNRQQISVLSHYTDGQVVDVTARAQYDSNDSDIAVVDGAGLVRSLDASGEAAIMARYQGQVAVFRAVVPLGMKIPKYEFEPHTLVDRFTAKKWQELGIVPSDPATDEQFMRRVSLDITGTMPNAGAKVKAFLADNDPNKRDKLIDAISGNPGVRLLFPPIAGPTSCASNAVARTTRAGLSAPSLFTAGFAAASRAISPVDQFVREILTALGDETRAPTTMWYRDLQKPEQFVDDTCQHISGRAHGVILGATIIRMKNGARTIILAWPPSSPRLDARRFPIPGLNPQGQQNIKQVIFNKPNGKVINTRTQQPAAMKVLDGPALTLIAGDDPRPYLVNWMVDANIVPSSPGPWPIATGHTFSARASSIRSTICASPTRPRTQNCSMPWPKIWSTPSSASSI